jgi:hypothetical protein
MGPVFDPFRPSRASRSLHPSHRSRGRTSSFFEVEDGLGCSCRSHGDRRTMGPPCAAPIDARSRRPRERESRPAAARRGLSTDDTGSPVTADYPAGGRQRFERHDSLDQDRARQRRPHAPDSGGLALRGRDDQTVGNGGNLSRVRFPPPPYFPQMAGFRSERSREPSFLPRPRA